jgi:flagellar motor switch protein FliM
MFSKRQEQTFSILYLKSSVLKGTCKNRDRRKIHNYVETLTIVNENIDNKYMYSLNNMFGKKYHNNLKNTQIFEMKSREMQLTCHINDQVT